MMMFVGVRPTVPLYEHPSCSFFGSLVDAGVIFAAYSGSRFRGIYAWGG